MRKNITQPPDWWAAFEREARRNGQTLSEWVGSAGHDRLTKKAQKQLSERSGAGRPKSEIKNKD